MSTSSIPILYASVFAGLILLSWIGGSAMAALDFKLVMQVQALLVQQLEALQARCDRLHRENTQLKEQSYDTDAKLRVALSRVDELSADLSALKHDPDSFS